MFLIDVWSDVVCPFCYLGRRQLQGALAQFEHADRVVVRHRAFELDPRADAQDSLSLDEMLASKYSMPLERARMLNRRIEEDARALGMEWALQDARPTNTFDAHRLISLAATQGLDETMSERLYAAYFSEGRVVSDHDTLNELADEVGVVDCRSLWGGDAYENEVRADEAAAADLGITGVPSMLLDEKFMIVGAQGTPTILDALQRAWSRRDLV